MHPIPSDPSGRQNIKEAQTIAGSTQSDRATEVKTHGLKRFIR